MRKISRRKFLERTGAGVAVAATVVNPVEAGSPASGGSHADLGAQASSTANPGSVPRTKIRLTINGRAQTVEVEDRWTLVELLRDHLNLPGTKIGCDRGECGACTVLLDGKPVYSCSNLAVGADGRTVETVEGLAANGKLHPLQQAFVDHDAPQCGFCTSGQLMAAVAFVRANNRPNADEVRRAMTGNICRCSSYNHYVDAVLAAGSNGAASRRAVTVRTEPWAGAPFAPLTTVGHATPRIDAVQRVSGSATYTGDVRLPGMLYAKVLRSPHPHAQIKSIDVSKARALAGVKAN